MHRRHLFMKNVHLLSCGLDHVIFEHSPRGEHLVVASMAVWPGKMFAVRQ